MHAAYPKKTSNNRALPLGWLLSAEGRLRGFLGNVPLRMSIGSQKILAVAMRSMAVEPSFTSFSYALLARFLSQESPKVFLNTSANAAISPLLQRAGFKSVPQPHLKESLVWILQPKKVLSAFFLRLGVPAGLSEFMAALGEPLLKLEKQFRRRGFGSACGKPVIAQIRPENLNREFDELWLEFKKTNPGKILSERAPSDLRRHFCFKNNTISEAQIFACRLQGKLKGYLATGVETSPRTGIRRCRVVDLVVPSEKKTVIRRLLESAYAQSLQGGSHLFELTGFSESVRKVGLEANPYTQKHECPRYWYATRDAGLGRRLRHASSWYASPFDGDATL